uniref:Uncharacterized protein n=1 Tax=Oryza meridionalis TaxID=40149 RepID=A0A0E0EUZ4_9ORYZ
MSVINFPRLYREFDRICVLEFPFVDAPHLLETILEVGKPGEEKTWLIGNLPELIEITRFRVAFLRVSSSLERLLSLWKTHGILEIDWDFIGAVEHAVAALHPLSDHQPEALRNGVLGLLERLKLFPVQPDDADSTDVIASTKLVSDVELIVKDMSLLGLIPIKYPALRDQSAFLPVSVVENQPEVQESPYIRIRSYNELLLTMDSQFPIDICIVSFKLSDATKVSHRVDKAIEKGWWVGNIDILHTTSHFRSIISRISESISNLQMTLLEVPPIPADIITNQMEYPNELVKGIPAKLDKLLFEANTIQGLKVQYPDPEGLKVNGLSDITPVANSPQLYLHLKHMCILGVTFAHAPYMLEQVLKVGKEREVNRWLVGNLAELKEIASFRTAFLCLVSSLESLSKKHQILEDDWNMIAAVKDAVARLPPLSDRQPEALRAEVLKLLERLESTLPVQPGGSDSSGANSLEVLSSTLTSDVGAILKDMYEVGLRHIEYTQVDLPAFMELEDEEENQPEYPDTDHLPPSP